LDFQEKQVSVNKSRLALPKVIQANVNKTLIDVGRLFNCTDKKRGTERKSALIITE